MVPRSVVVLRGANLCDQNHRLNTNLFPRQTNRRNSERSFQRYSTSYRNTGGESDHKFHNAYTPNPVHVQYTKRVSYVPAVYVVSASERHPLDRPKLGRCEQMFTVRNAYTPNPVHVQYTKRVSCVLAVYLVSASEQTTHKKRAPCTVGAVSENTHRVKRPTQLR